MKFLVANERLAVASAIGRRQQEFAAGRMAARAAMLRLGRKPEPVPMKSDRSPNWPSGLVGSISHSQTTCVAVVALDCSWQSVGVDVEPDLSLSADLWDSILTPEEMRRVRQIPNEFQGRWAMRVFCAKEAYYKWVYSRVRTVLDFHDVVIDIDATMEGSRFSVRLLHNAAQGSISPSVEGTLSVTQGLLVGLLIH